MAGIDAFGTKFQFESATPDVFTDVGNVGDITAPKMERETTDVTTHDSLEGWREYIGGLKDGGEVSIKLNYDPAKHDSLFSHFTSNTAKTYRIVWPGSLGSWEFTAVMTGFSVEAPVEGQLSAELSFQVSGKPTLTTGAGA